MKGNLSSEAVWSERLKNVTNDHICFCTRFLHVCFILTWLDLVVGRWLSTVQGLLGFFLHKHAGNKPLILGGCLYVPSYFEYMQKKRLPLKLSGTWNKQQLSPKLPANHFSHWPKLYHGHCQPSNGTVLSYLGWNYVNLIILEPYTPIGSQILCYPPQCPLPLT